MKFAAIFYLGSGAAFTASAFMHHPGPAFFGAIALLVGAGLDRSGY